VDGGNGFGEEGVGQWFLLVSRTLLTIWLKAVDPLDKTTTLLRDM